MHSGPLAAAVPQAPVVVGARHAHRAGEHDLAWMSLLRGAMLHVGRRRASARLRRASASCRSRASARRPHGDAIRDEEAEGGGGERTHRRGGEPRAELGRAGASAGRCRGPAAASALSVDDDGQNGGERLPRLVATAAAVASPPRPGGRASRGTGRPSRREASREIGSATKLEQPSPAQHGGRGAPPGQAQIEPSGAPGRAARPARCAATPSEREKTRERARARLPGTRRGEGVTHCHRAGTPRRGLRRRAAARRRLGHCAPRRR